MAQVRIVPSCGGARGGHYCVTCGHGLRNNMEANAHDQTHRIVWNCPEHGFEAVPHTSNDPH